MFTPWLNSKVKSYYYVLYDSNLLLIIIFQNQVWMYFHEIQIYLKNIISVYIFSSKHVEFKQEEELEKNAYWE